MRKDPPFRNNTEYMQIAMVNRPENIIKLTNRQDIGMWIGCFCKFSPPPPMILAHRRRKMFWGILGKTLNLIPLPPNENSSPPMFDLSPPLLKK